MPSFIPLSTTFSPIHSFIHQSTSLFTNSLLYNNKSFANFTIYFYLHLYEENCSHILLDHPS
jgi:hypothetical protein